MLPYADLAGFDENNEYNENPLRYGVYRRGFVGERLRLCTTSQPSLTLGSSPTRGTVTAQPVTKRLYRERLFLSDVGKV